MAMILRCWWLTFAGLAALLAVAAASAARASLSEYLIQRIQEAHKAESNKQFELALRIYQQAIDKELASGGNIRALLKQRAALYEQLSVPDKAEADLTAIFNIKPFDPQSLVDRGYFYLRRNRFADALGDFLAASRYDRKNPRYLYGAGRVLVAARDFVNAVNFYSEAIKLGPGDATLYLARAEAYVNLKMMSEAGADYEKALALGLKERTDRFFAFAGRGYVRLQAGNYDGAIRDLDRALGFDPDALNARLWRAHAYEMAGEPDLAVRDYERALTIMPDSIPARQGIQRLRAQ